MGLFNNVKPEAYRIDIIGLLPMYSIFSGDIATVYRVFSNMVLYSHVFHTKGIPERSTIVQ
jgi:hypothetical protein